MDEESISRFDCEETTTDAVHIYSLGHAKEKYQLIWLDANVNNGSDDSVFTLRSLQNLVDLTSKFDNLEDCVLYIEQTQDITTFLICSGTLGKQLVPRIHSQKNIWAIYLYCFDVDSHEDWASSYSQVSLIFFQTKRTRVSLCYLCRSKPCVQVSSFY